MRRIGGDPTPVAQPSPGETKGVAKPRLRGRPSHLPLVSESKITEWGSLLADLSSDARREPEWLVHDRTHLECALDYERPEGRSAFEWELYCFLPASLRVDDASYGRERAYEDLQSYMRFAVPRIPLEELLGDPSTRLRKAMADEVAPETTLREMRIFACLLRASGVQAQRAILRLLRGTPDERATAEQASAHFAQLSQVVSQTLRESLGSMSEAKRASHEPLARGARWVEEDVSRVLETLLASLAVEFRRHPDMKKAATTLAAAAVQQARHRRDHGMESVGRATDGKREVERLEFRRHVLKRFTSSVLWLRLRVQPAAMILKHAVYAVAAAAAMAFAIAAALWNGTDPRTSGNLWLWVTAAVLAYAAKDRIKAVLQSFFSRTVFRRLPDRRWQIHDRERSTKLGRVSEGLAFVRSSAVAPEVLAARHQNRTDRSQDDFRPETILWHRKTCQFTAPKSNAEDSRFRTITEIVRLDLSRWLTHTDDPKRKIVFADPDDWHIYSAVAPRVYNLYFVYRFSTPEHPDPEWKRVRVVVTRKGIVRVDSASLAPAAG